MAFNLGFWVGICLFAFINSVSYIVSYAEHHRPEMKFADAGGYAIGFPMTFYRWEFGYPFRFYFVWSGLIADILIGITFTFVVGFVFKFVWTKIQPQNLK
jgi:hypothetical protein